MEGMTRSQRKRAAILSAAAAEFELRGFRDTSMDRIAERAEVSKRTVYNHFPTKDELFRAIVGELLEQLQQLGQQGYDPQAQLADQLKSLAHEIVELFSNPRAIGMTRTMIAEVTRSPQLIHEIFEQELGEDALLIWVRGAINAGALKPSSAARLAKQLSALLKGQLFWPQVLGIETQPSPEERQAIINDAVAMFLNQHQRTNTCSSTPSSTS